MSEKLVFLTGATGHVGFAVLVDALKTGYKVRASVRKEEQIGKLKAHKILQPFLSKLEFVVVPNILNEGAFSPYLTGVNHIIHVASPLVQPSEDPQRDVIDPAIYGTLSILKDAAKVSSIERVVITSSVVAIIPTASILVSNGDAENVYDYKSVAPTPPPEYSHPFVAYAASKTLALHATKKYLDEAKPNYQVTHVYPSFILGRNEHLTSAKSLADGVNGIVGKRIIPGETPSPGMFGISVHIDDVARVHVLALDPKVPAGENFPANTSVESVNYDDAAGIVKKNYAKEVEKGIFAFPEPVASPIIRYDPSHTEKVLGIKFLSYEEQVKSVADQYLELLSG